jgi:hypothetical protein
MPGHLIVTGEHWKPQLNVEQTVILYPLFVTVIFLELESLELFQKNNCFAHPYPQSILRTPIRHYQVLDSTAVVICDCQHMNGSPDPCL